MEITKKAWNNYIQTISKLDDKATEMIKAWVDKNGLMDKEKLVDYSYNVVQTLSRGSGAMAADWYDAIARLQGVAVPSAEMAELPTYGDVAKTVYGVMKRTVNPDAIASATSNLVKRTAADTTLQNAKRDGAEFAWIPVGDTCPFCMELASFGWREASDKILKGDHAEHIHANCDCEFAIRFGDDLKYASYNPDVYKEMFDNAEGRTMDEKRNAIRRMQYQENKDRINAQKREAYAERNLSEHSRSVKYGETAIYVDEKYINSEEYKAKFRGLSQSEEGDEKIYEHAKNILKDRSGTENETLILVDKRTGDAIVTIKTESDINRIKYSKEDLDKIEDAKKSGAEILAIHNHPTGYPPTADDASAAFLRKYTEGITCGHNGNVWVYKPSNELYTTKECKEIHDMINDDCKFVSDIDKMIKIWKDDLEAFGIRIHERR